MPVIETNTEGVWVSRQTARGTPATTAIKQGRKVGGDADTNRDDGEVRYSDGNRFQNAADHVTSIRGDGTPQILAEPGVLGYLLYLFMGQEVVTGSADPYTHTFTPAVSSFWATWWKKVGRTVGPLRQKHNDTRMVSLQVEASHQKPELVATPKFLALDPGEIYASDPAKTQDLGETNFLYEDGEGTFTIDGTVFRGHSSLQVNMGEGITPIYGDSVLPFDVEAGVEKISGACTLYVDAAGLAEYYTVLYGTPTPAPGAKPIKKVVLGSYSWLLTQSATRSVQLTLPLVKWAPDLKVAGDVAGKAATLAMKFEARTPADGVTPIVTWVVKNGDPGYV